MRHYTQLIQHVSDTLEERLSFIHKKFQSTYRDFLPEKSYHFAPQSLDLFESILTLHWQQDLPSIFSTIKNALKSQGVFMGALFGSQTLQELKAVFTYVEEKRLGYVTPHFLPLPSPQDIARILQHQRFISPVVDREVIVQEYNYLQDLYSDLRQMGERNCLKNRFKGLTTPRFMKDCETLYKGKFSTSQGKIFATFEILYFIAWQDKVENDPR